MLDDYLDKTDELMSATAEGRAFEGAFTLLRDEALLLDLKNDLQTILDHPFATVLTPSEERDFRGTVTVIRQGIDDVLSQRSRLTTTLRDHIMNHDVVKERELDALLREINKERAVWMLSAGPRSTVPIELMPGTPEIEHLRERFHDPGSDAYSLDASCHCVCRADESTGTGSCSYQEARAISTPAPTSMRWARPKACRG